MTLHRWTLLGVLAVALTACSSTPSPTQITVLATEFTYTPAEIRVSAGQTVQLTLDNQGTVEHDFSVLDMPIEEGSAVSTPSAEHEMAQMDTEPKIHVAAPAGASATIDFTPTKPGSYPFQCTVPGHKENGMVGTLVVLQP